MKKLLLCLSAAFLLACKNDKPLAIADNNLTTQAKAFDREDYEAFKSFLPKRRASLAGRPHSEVTAYLFDLVNDSIYNYWKGTPWAFHGMTRAPQEGEIACGYFVTNTLFDLGFEIDRIKLAQCISGDMIKALCVDIHSFNGIKNFKAYMEKQPVNSVYIVGLDYHTGYIVKDAANSYFLHSNYINHQGVVKERIEESAALQSNKFFMIGSLTSNKKLLQKWVSQ